MRAVQMGSLYSTRFLLGANSSVVPAPGVGATLLDHREGQDFGPGLLDPRDQALECSDLIRKHPKKLNPPEKRFWLGV